MDADCLDLCLACGSHVADGTAYCSRRCQSQDASARHAVSQSPYTYPSSSSSLYHQSPASHINAPRRRQLLELQDPSSSTAQYTYAYAASTSSSSGSPFCRREMHQQHVRKLANIQEWANGVWGTVEDEEQQQLQKQKQQREVSVFSDDDDEESDYIQMKSSRSSRRSPLSSGSSSSKSSAKSSPSRHSPRSSISYTPPRFQLTAAHLAPPAMSITTSLSSGSVVESDLLTPPSSATSRESSLKKQALPKNLKSGRDAAGAVDPWISSPPYEFAYNHFAAVQSTKIAHERGRPLVRV